MLGVMKITRSEFVVGFMHLGFLGLLIGVVVVPGQWASGTIRPEALIGLVWSTACVLAAVCLAQSIKPALVVLAQLLLVVGAFCLALVPFVAAEVGWSHWQRVGSLGLACAVAVFIGWYMLHRFRRPDLQLKVHNDAA